jgi:hypothetical protein
VSRGIAIDAGDDGSSPSYFTRDKGQLRIRLHRRRGDSPLFVRLLALLRVIGVGKLIVVT